MKKIYKMKILPPAGKFKLKLRLFPLLIFSWILLSWLLLVAIGDKSVFSQELKNQQIFRITVPANQSWTDTGLEVVEGQAIIFDASGIICLQQGNPIANCGPDGYKLKTVQQPLPDQNIGSLIGKVVQLISVETDKETGQEIRNEITKEFYIGPTARVRMPLSGHLFLGVNENLVADNSGEFKVIIYLLKNKKNKNSFFFKLFPFNF